MDCDLLFKLRNSYYLGKHKNTLNLWEEWLSSGATLTETQMEDVGVVMQKTLLMLLKAANGDVIIFFKLLFRV